MRWLIFTIFLGGCSLNQGLLISSNVMLAADWAQTRQIAKGIPGIHETNVIMGEHPSIGRVNTYFASCILLNTAAYPLMPEKWRAWWYGGLTIFEAVVVSRNLSLGISF